MKFVATFVKSIKVSPPEDTVLEPSVKSKTQSTQAITSLSPSCESSVLTPYFMNVVVTAMTASYSR